jgi:esterase/lipase superfamily enzyme
MPKYWLISDRNNGGIGTERNVAGLSYFVSDAEPLTDINNWRKVSPTQFSTLLKAAADAFPALTQGENEDQSHVTILIHGFNVSFQSSTGFYQDVCGSLFDGANSLGLCVLYDWPSLGTVVGYEPDRAHARECAEDLTNILSELYDWLLKKQQDAIKSKGNPEKACRAKLSVIAHNMGNYLLQKAMAAAWTRKNQPLLASLINQLVMAAADVDNNLFDAGAPDNDDGAAMANFSYRITALYSGRDAVLGASAGLKHFGTRRLGRSGLATRPPLVTAPPQTDNVWDVDCTDFFPPEKVTAMNVHGAYFYTADTIELIRKILRGIDRGVLEKLGATRPETQAPPASGQARTGLAVPPNSPT